MKVVIKELEMNEKWLCNDSSLWMKSTKQMKSVKAQALHQAILVPSNKRLLKFSLVKYVYISSPLLLLNHQCASETPV